MKKYMIIIIIMAVLFAAGCAESDDEETNISSEGSSGGQEVAQEVPTEVCYVDWQYSFTPFIGSYYKAPTGYNYAVVNIYLQNEANVPVSTNPYFWKFSANGLQYDVDVSTFSEEVNHQTIEVGKGGRFETTLVYLVKDYPHQANLTYTGLQSPYFERMQHYTTE